MRAKRNMGISVGGSSILMIFVVLTMTTFATLSMVSANADFSFTQKNGDTVSAYYKADSLAEDRLAEVDQTLAALQGKYNERRTYYAAVVDAMFENKNITITEQDNAGYALSISYSVPITEDKELKVGLTLHAYGAPERYTITEWHTKSLKSEQFTDLDDDGIDIAPPVS